MTADTVATERITPPASRNHPCPCGSGKRYKQCHGVAAAAGADAKSSATLTELMDAALRAQLDGDHPEAEQLYRAALAIAPEQPDCLHMLGVVRLHRLDFDEARSLIERAGELVGWQPHSYRHNYGYLLSALLSAREPLSLPDRLAALQAQRQAHAKSASAAAARADFAVLVLCREGQDDLLARTLASLAALHQPPLSIILLGAVPATIAAASAGGAAITCVAWNEQAVAASLAAALTHCSAAFVTLFKAGDEAVELADVIATVAAAGGAWGVARCEMAGDAAPGDDHLPAAGLRNLFGMAQHSERLGAALFADHTVLTPVANVVWQRHFLLARLAEGPEHFVTLCELSIWHGEPVFVDRVSHRFLQRQPGTAAFWQHKFASAEPFMALALSGNLAPNPLAPSLEFDGPSFMKRALRLGLGQRLAPVTLRRVAALVLAPAPSPPALATDGIEWIGFVRAEIGLGESLRLMAQACLAADVPIALTNIPLDLGVRQGERSLQRYEVTRPRYRTRVISTNPDNLGEGNFVDGAFALPSAYNIGYWYWELETLPPAWADFDRVIDELWVATDFVAAAARKALSVPVSKITPPIPPPRLVRDYRRDEFGLDGDAFTFMFSFDFGSYPARKNPEGVVRAFKRAFPPQRRDVRLLLKCHRGHTFPVAQAALADEIGNDARIILFDQTISRDDLTGLQSVIDCYVSLHRSEGLGLGMAECMALGKPVIATAYSGNLEFTRPHNSLLVDFEKVPLAPDAYLVWRDQVWAEPSIDHAAAHMRTLADDPQLARQIGAAGRATIVDEYSPRAVGERVKQRLQVINAQLDRRV